MKWDGRVSYLALMAAGCLATLSSASAQEGQTVQLQEILIQTTPVPGAVGIDVNKVPALVSTVPSKDFTERRSPTVTDAITSHVPGAISLNVDGSDLSPDLYYRGFAVSRISGVAQGLAVYQNGVRINEAFGDSVNLDLVPPIAVDHADVYTNNPIFGLNALGGAIAFTMKNGFNFQGGDATILGGSYGRVNGNFEYGKQVGNYSFYMAADGYRDGGYRPFGAQNAERAYADLGYRSQDSELHLIGGYGRSLLGVQGVTPLPLVQNQYNSVFTTPQTTENQAGLAQLTGRFDVGRNWTINSNFYMRKFDQYHVDGNDADVEECDGFAGAAGTLCVDEDAAPPGTNPRRLQFIDQNGKAVKFDPNVAAYGTTARTATHSTTFGTQQQATNREKIFGHDNYFVVGGSVDTSYTNFSSTTSLGQLNPAFENIESGCVECGVLLQTRGNIGIAPVFVSSTATYYGLFALDTFNVTRQLALTAGARFNIAKLTLQDLSGLDPDLNSSSSYSRINPVVGVTYEFTPAFTVYGGYSEANRAPTPLESACADPARPCILETSLVADPPLKQVVSHTIEAGARGHYVIPAGYGEFAYKAGYFRTNTTDDILSQASAITGQGFFANVPETLRQGVEAGIIYARGPWEIYANYAYVDATYRFTSVFSSPNNPFANGRGNIIIRPGDHITGVPRNLGKVGFEYAVTPRFKVGMDTIFVGSQYYVGDESNQNPQLPFYSVWNARASYQLTDHLQVFGLINNFTNNRYATFGTFFEPDTSGAGVSPILVANAASANPNQQAITVAQPLSVYGGVKLTF